MAAQIPNIVTHGELTVEQLAHIQKNILVQLRNDTFWDKFCSHTVVPEGMSSVEWRKLNIPELKPSQIANLTEGVTPAGLKLEYVKFTVSPVNYGSWIGYTDESKKYNYDDVVRDAKTVLGQRAKDEAEIRKAQQFISGTCTMSLTSGDKKFVGDALKARTYLKKNHMKPIARGKFGCIMTPEQAAKVLLDYASEITHTSEKEALINGYIGELAGFILFECADEVMYKRTAAVEADVEKGIEAVSANTEGYCLFFGKSEFGMPVQTVAFGDASVHVFDNGLGSVPSKDASGNILPDALHQRGSVGYKVMGFATRILADEAIIRALYVIDSSSDEGDDRLDVVDANRTGYSAKSSSPAE